jgi:hypothetical protein
MSVFWQYYLGIAVGWLVLMGYLLLKVPIFLVLLVGVWLFYTLLRCPDCKTLIKRNRLSWWRLPSTTCLKCGRDLTKP